MRRVLLLLPLLVLSRPALAGQAVPVQLLQVHVEGGDSILYEGSSADREWLFGWLENRHARREVVLEGHAPGGAPLPRYAYHGCLLTDIRSGSREVEWLELACASVSLSPR